MIMALCGIPASGKTTLAKELKEKYNAKLHSYDDVYGANNITICSMEEVYNRYIQGIKEDINNGYDVICDNTNLTINHRVKLLNNLKNYNNKKILYILTTPLDECIKRNEERVNNLPLFIITQSQEMYEQPTYKEGWDKIILVNAKKK